MPSRPSLKETFNFLEFEVFINENKLGKRVVK